MQLKGEMGPDKALKEGERVEEKSLTEETEQSEERGMVEICQKRAPANLSAADRSNSGRTMKQRSSGKEGHLSFLWKQLELSAPKSKSMRGQRGKIGW